VISYVIDKAVMDRVVSMQHKERQFMLVCNLVPLVASLLPLAFNKYGYTQGWCSVELTDHDFILESVLRALVFYGPLYLVFGYCLFTYHRVVKVISKHTEPSARLTSAKALMLKLYLYPLVLIACYALVTVYRIYSFVKRQSTNFPLAYCSALLICLNGLLNSLVYGFNKHVRRAIADKCRWSSQVTGELSIGSLGSSMSERVSTVIITR
jgi:hypothetical protein